MTQDDRDNLFILMVIYNNLDIWAKDTTSELNQKDRNKITAISRLIMDLFVQYRKREGEIAFKALCEESEKFKVAVIAKKEEIATFDSFSSNLMQNSIKNIINKCSECQLCNGKDFTKCDWFTLHKFVNSKENNNGKKVCPFKENVNDLFDVEI